MGRARVLSSSATASRTEGDIMATTDNKQLMQHIFSEAAKGNLEPFLEHWLRYVLDRHRHHQIFWDATGKQEVIDKRLTPVDPARRPDPRYRPHLYCRRGLRGDRGTRPSHDQDGETV